MTHLTTTAMRLMNEHYGPFFAGKYMAERNASLRAARETNDSFTRRMHVMTAIDQHRSFLRVLREVRRGR